MQENLFKDLDLSIYVQIRFKQDKETTHKAK